MKQLIRNNNDLATFVDYLMNIKEIKYTLVAEIKKLRQNRSLDQNALLWLWLTCLEKDSETGYTKDEFYQMFISKFAPRKMVFDEIIRITSSKMDSKQMTEFLDNIQIFVLVELGIKLPNPNDLRFAEFYEKYNET